MKAALAAVPVIETGIAPKLATAIALLEAMREMLAVAIAVLGATLEMFAVAIAR